MYRVDRNNFYKEAKKATIQTPERLSNFLFELLDKTIDPNGIIFDPCVGEGSLLKPFFKNGFKTIGIDVHYQGFENTIIKNFLDVKIGEIQKPAITIMNPPFNIDETTKNYIKKNYNGRPLLPEIWFSKVLELFGKDAPIVMFTPYGFRLNQSQSSKRWKKFKNGEYPEICSIMSLPKDIFEGILFHSEILFFNIQNLKSHYFFNG